METPGFPNEIDLGRKEPDGMAVTAPSVGKKGKARIFYPTLYIDSVPGLDQLPKEGCMMVRFRRTRLSLEEGRDGKETAGATLEIRALCLPEGDGETLEDAFAKLGKGEVADDGADYGDADAEEEDDDGE